MLSPRKSQFFPMTNMNEIGLSEIFNISLNPFINNLPALAKGSGILNPALKLCNQNVNFKPKSC